MAARLLLDTNAYSAMRQGHPEVARRIAQSERILLSSVVLGELLYGFRHGSRFDQNWQKLEAFLAEPAVEPLGVTLRTAHRFGTISTQLRRDGLPIPTNDIWIAAHAMEFEAELLSFDTHFSHVHDLSWTSP